MRSREKQQTTGAQEEWSLEEWKSGSEQGQLAKDMTAEYRKGQSEEKRINLTMLVWH